MNDRPRKMPTKRAPKKEKTPPLGVVPPLPAVYDKEPEPEPVRATPKKIDKFVLAWLVVAAATVLFVVWAYVARN